MGKRAYRIVSSALVIAALGACGQQTANTPNASSSVAAETDHSGMNHGGSASSTTATANAPFDAMFIDGMTIHHQGAIDMARDAAQQAEHAEIKQLAQEIITAQEAEIGQMRDWRTQWYADVPATGSMATDMGDMHVSDDASTPFDQRFLAAMIGHHQGAIDMAREALTQAEHGEIKQLAQEIIRHKSARSPKCVAGSNNGTVCSRSWDRICSRHPPRNLKGERPSHAGKVVVSWSALFT